MGNKNYIANANQKMQHLKDGDYEGQVVNDMLSINIGKAVINNILINKHFDTLELVSIKISGGNIYIYSK